MGDRNLDRVMNPWRYNADGTLASKASPPVQTVQATPPAGQPEVSAVDIKVRTAVLRQASGAAAQVHHSLSTDGRIADDTTAEAASSLSQKDFQLGRALKTTGELWESQMTTLVQACHKIEQNLAANAEGHQMTEDANEMRMVEIAKHFH
jgi:uncharacterized protein YukE